MVCRYVVLAQAVRDFWCRVSGLCDQRPCSVPSITLMNCINVINVVDRSREGTPRNCGCILEATRWRAAATSIDIDGMQGATIDIDGMQGAKPFLAHNCWVLLHCHLFLFFRGCCSPICWLSRETEYSRRKSAGIMIALLWSHLYVRVHPASPWLLRRAMARMKHLRK